MSLSLRHAPKFARCVAAVMPALIALGLVTQSTEVRAQTAQMTAGVGVDGRPIDLSNIIQNPKSASPLRSTAMGLAPTGKASTPQEQQAFDTFVVFRIAELTWPPGDSRDTIDRRRQKFKSYEILRGTGLAPDQTLHDRANQLALLNLPGLIAKADYPMDARYNAMLLLGQLDKVEPDAAQNKPAVPLEGAQQILLQAARTPTLPEILRIGALIGIARHCDLQMGSTNRKAFADEALALLKAKTPPQGYSANGFHWARKQALAMVMGLSKTGSETANPDFVQAIAEIIGGDQEPLFLRRDAALAFGFLDPAVVAAGGKVKPADVCKAFVGLTSAVMKAGQPRFDPSAPVDLSKPEDVFPQPTEDNKTQFANAVAYYLNCIAVGLGGRDAPQPRRGLLKALQPADPAFQHATTLLNTHVNALVTALSKPNPDSNRLLSDLESKRGPFDAWAEQNQLLAAPAGAAAPAAGTGVAAPAGPAAPVAGTLASPTAPRQ